MCPVGVLLTLNDKLRHMPAPFAAQLCAYRPKNEGLNTSGNNDEFSVELGRYLFEEMGVPAGRSWETLPARKWRTPL